MIRRPPRSTLFPTRRSSDLIVRHVDDRRDSTGRSGAGRGVEILHPLRSEEHTSELQSLAYLVCRLLLEKKKSHSIVLSAPLKSIRQSHFETPSAQREAIYMP